MRTRVIALWSRKKPRRWSNVARKHPSATREVWRSIDSMPYTKLLSRWWPPFRYLPFDEKNSERKSLEKTIFSLLLMYTDCSRCWIILIDSSSRDELSTLNNLSLSRASWSNRQVSTSTVHPQVTINFYFNSFFYRERELKRKIFRDIQSCFEKARELMSSKFEGRLSDFRYLRRILQFTSYNIRNT